MAILGTLLKKGIRLRESLEQEYSNPLELQKQSLKKLLIAAKDTEIGKKYGFAEILKSFKQSGDAFHQKFSEKVPLYNYEKIYEEWWHSLKDGKKNITWPGSIRYFALTSGTSGASSKYIPITKDMVKAIRRTGVRQILSLSKYDIPDDLFTKGILMLGGSTDLEFNGTFFSGDLSGITTGKLPVWFQRFYKPGKKISKNKDWGEKLEQIVQQAPSWDIGIIVGVPAWLQILLEKIIDRYQLQHIHELWPNLQIFVHGGVSFEPYKKGFEKLLGKPLIYMETYLASEGFLAFQALPHRNSMRLVLNNGIFHEFIPFNDANFDEHGEVKPDASILNISQVKEGVDYALLISTCSGAWRYMIGDTIRFESKAEVEIRITGRTKHFLSLCGEHLSVDNINQAVKRAEEELNIDIREFTVTGLPHGTLFAHHWFAGTDSAVSEEILRARIDAYLHELNDDYAVERKHALKEMRLSKIPSHLFYDWLRAQGKEGGQNKFPRVLKGEKMKDWLQFLQNNGVQL
ncbi:GH3 family domain-containing protein [Mongoliitalea daihaiensis]|uniref:GH3 family domain-containing protein n=1 Tax=Mongoliitalea daihaiensis TaxID=2782006 RepID=UPI001F2F9310|nr:GH3 auxin-responsive promoter family protein [Mongoliitalea daihaiensis]UJP67077.1 GH3 auxin-responsive promoter family protein [Mongoliitalea daihaiensis]